MTDKSASNNEQKKSRRMNGFVLLALFFLAIFALTYRPTIETIFCDETTLNPKPDVIMLGAWWCPYCSQARKYFQNHEISYCEYDMERSDEGKRLYREVNGQAIPILLIGKHQINGFNERSIETALERLHSK
jgi:glutaredoxin